MASMSHFLIVLNTEKYLWYAWDHRGFTLCKNEKDSDLAH